MALDPSAVGFTSAPSILVYDWKTVVLYALGIGAKRDELDYLYEGRGPRVFPTFAVLPAMPAVMECFAKTGGDFATVVHGAQSVRIHKPIPPSGKLVTTATLRGMYDMKKFAQVVAESTTSLEGGEPLFETVWSVIYRGGGGFAGPRPPKSDAIDPPKDRPADFHVELATSPEQALLYRLCGDTNPLHADPAFAASVGFTDGPILHGLCTYGFAGRALLHALCGSDPARFRGMAGRFSRPVVPGQTLTTRIWVESGGEARFQTQTEDGTVVIDRGWCAFG